MKTYRKISKSIAGLLAVVFMFSSCASTTMIQSNPSGADVYLNGESVGITPYQMSDTKIAGTCTLVRLEKDGYEVMNSSICRNEEADVGAIIGGLFFLVPFLWTMKYKAVHSYNLPELEGFEAEPTTKLKANPEISEKTQKLLELKSLLEKEVITQEEFEKEKKKILESDLYDSVVE